MNNSIKDIYIILLNGNHDKYHATTIRAVKSWIGHKLYQEKERHGK